MLHVSASARAEHLRGDSSVDGRGVRFTKELTDEVNASLRLGDGSVRTVDFIRAVFPDEASFGGARFGDNSSFAGAAFGSRAYFRGAVFGEGITFDNAKFGSHPNFRGATFGSKASFANVDFGFNPWFRGAVFGDRASFFRAKFGDHAYFRYTKFGSGTTFAEAAFGRSADFVDAVRFEGDVSFNAAVFGDDLSFGKALFDQHAAFSNVTFGARARFNVFGREVVTFAHARFGNHVEIDFAGRELNLYGTDFSEGGSIRAWDTDIQLARAKFGAPFLLTRRHPVVGPKVSAPEIPGKRNPVVIDLDPDPEGFARTTAVPRVASLDEADVRNLVIDQVDLGRCRFNRAHNLDQLRVASGDQFLLPERRFGLTQRRVVIEEYLWRARYERRRLWSLPDPPDASGPADSPRAEARQVEQTYRALRKAFEDLKNEPGSADFYYGEMEMRRRGSESQGERFLLYGYWLLAGYGLRAWRAFAALAVTVAIATAIFASVGFASASTTIYVPAAGGAFIQTAVPGPKPGWLEAFSYSAHSVTSLVRPAGTIPLTGIGTYTELILRVLGPLLLGLAVLSIRARVKR